MPAPTAVRLEETFGVRGAREARGVCHRRRAATAPIQVATGASVFLGGVPRARRGAAAALNHNAAGGILILRVGPAGGRHEPPGVPAAPAATQAPTTWAFHDYRLPLPIRRRGARHREVGGLRVFGVSE